MTQVRPDQQRADGPVKVVENIQGLLRSGFIPLDSGFDPVAGTGGKRRFGNGEIKSAK